MYQFVTEGMSCQHCVRTVTQAVQEVDPEAQVKIDLASQRITVESATEKDQIVHAIEEAGYPIQKQ
jgi:copper chaperone